MSKSVIGEELSPFCSQLIPKLIGRPPASLAERNISWPFLLRHGGLGFRHLAHYSDIELIVS